MPRKLFFKETNETVTPPSGYVSFGIGGDGKILTTNDQNQTTPGNDTTFDCFISSSQSYMIGTWSVYPFTWQTGFKYLDNYMYLMCMNTIQTPYDHYDDDGVSNFYWGLFKENQNKLEFMGGWDPLEVLGLSRTDYLEGFNYIYSFQVYATGSGYTSSNDVALTGGSGTGCIVNITESSGVPIINIVDGGQFYQKNDVLTVPGGDGNHQIIVDHNTGSKSYYNYFDSSLKVVSGGAEFSDIAMDLNWGPTNRYIKYKMNLDTDGSILGFTLSETRDFSSPSSSIIIDLLPGYEAFGSGLVRNYQASPSDTYQNTDKFYCLVKNTSTEQRDWLGYDIITNQFTTIIEDLESWWGIYATGVSWLDYLGNPPDFKVIEHSSVPILKAGWSNNPSQGSPYFSNSFLVEPTRFTKFGTNIMTDITGNVYFLTKNKIYFTSLIVKYFDGLANNDEPNFSEISNMFKQSIMPSVLLIFEYDVATGNIETSQRVLNYGEANAASRFIGWGENRALFMSLQDGVIFSSSGEESKIQTTNKLIARGYLGVTGKDLLLRFALTIDDYFYNMGIIPSEEGAWIISEKQFII